MFPQQKRTFGPFLTLMSEKKLRRNPFHGSRSFKHRFYSPSTLLVTWHAIWYQHKNHLILICTQVNLNRIQEHNAVSDRKKTSIPAIGADFNKFSKADIAIFIFAFSTPVANRTVDPHRACESTPATPLNLPCFHPWSALAFHPLDLSLRP